MCVSVRSGVCDGFAAHAVLTPHTRHRGSLSSQTRLCLLKLLYTHSQAGRNTHTHTPSKRIEGVRKGLKEEEEEQDDGGGTRNDEIRRC